MDCKLDGEMFQMMAHYDDNSTGINRETAHDKHLHNVATHRKKYFKDEKSYYDARNKEKELLSLNRPIDGEGFNFINRSNICQETYLNSSSGVSNNKPKPISLDDISSIGSSIRIDKISTNYTAIPTFNLPENDYIKTVSIYQHRTEILNAIENNQVVVLDGPTGCGKTTQVPQYIYDYCTLNRMPCNIIVTQPRRIAAITNSKRVANERKFCGDNIVSYQIGLENSVTQDTHITFCTTKILLRKLMYAYNLDLYTHIIIDEVHEHDIDIDFILCILKRFIETAPTKLKLIIMSATIQGQLFSRYFSTITFYNEHLKCPVIRIQAPRNFKINLFYLEDMINIGQPPSVELNTNRISDELYDFCLKLIDNLDLVETINFMNKKTILVFLPGIREIKKLRMILLKSKLKNIQVLPLHSTISRYDQYKIFNRDNLAKRKIILSTNISESSITIEDVEHVIDFCYSRNLKIHRFTNFKRLDTEWASKSSLNQRSGRCGRVCDGNVYRLINRNMFDQLSDYPTSQMVNSPMDKLILEVKVLNAGSPCEVLSRVITPPDISTIHQTIKILKMNGALKTSDVRGEIDVSALDGDITVLGLMCVELPVDIQLTRLIAFGFAMGVAYPAVVIACAMQEKSFLIKHFNSSILSQNVKYNWSLNSNSDEMCLFYAYKNWRSQIDQGVFCSDDINEEAWAERLGIDLTIINLVHSSVEEVKSKLLKFNMSITEEDEKKPINVFIIKMALAAASYPNYYTKKVQNEVTMAKELHNFNPFTTIKIQSRSMDAINFSLYKPQISDYFLRFNKRISNISVSNKSVYIEFIRDEEYPANEFLNSVVNSLKFHCLQTELIFLSPATYSANKKKETNAALLKLYENSRSEVTKTYQTIGVGASDILHDIYISHIPDRAQFYVQFNDKNSMDLLNSIFYQLNYSSSDLQHISMKPQTTVNIQVGMLYSGPLQINNDLSQYRCKVIALKRSHDLAKVFFVDYGHIQTLPISDLSSLPEELLSIPFQCFECELVSIRPCILLDGRWRTSLTNSFKQIIREYTDISIRIYSVVNNVRRVCLYVGQSSTNEHGNDEGRKCVNKLLVNTKSVIVTDETYHSTKNHQESKHINELAKRNKDNERMDDQRELEVLEKPKANKEYTSIKNVKFDTPYSPYTMCFQGMTQYTSTRKYSIVPNSINNIVMDKQPNMDCLLVASSMTMTGNDFCNIFASTIFPPSNCLSDIIPMLFSPCVVMKCDKMKTHYTGAICGVGWQKVGHSIFPALSEFDIKLFFKEKFENEDIKEINYIRKILSLLIGGISVKSGIKEKEQIKLSENLCKSICNLTTKTRSTIEQNTSYIEWKRCNEYDVNKSKDYQLLYPIELIRFNK